MLQGVKDDQELKVSTHTLLHYKGLLNEDKEGEAFVVYYFKKIIGNKREMNEGL